MDVIRTILAAVGLLTIVGTCSFVTYISVSIMRENRRREKERRVIDLETLTEIWEKHPNE